MKIDQSSVTVVTAHLSSGRELGAESIVKNLFNQEDFEEAKNKVREFLLSNRNVVVTGSLNSGKTSFINSILEGMSNIKTIDASGYPEDLKYVFETDGPFICEHHAKDYETFVRLANEKRVCGELNISLFVRLEYKNFRRQISFIQEISK